VAVSVEDESVANSGLPALLHELAEGLQSVGNYLGAGRQVARTDTSERHLYIDILEKALDELGRSKAAFHELRGSPPGFSVEGRGGGSK
jgi:hypothetical protein